MFPTLPRILMIAILLLAGAGGSVLLDTAGDGVSTTYPAPGIEPTVDPYPAPAPFPTYPPEPTMMVHGGPAPIPRPTPTVDIDWSGFERR